MTHSHYSISELCAEFNIAHSTFYREVASGRLNILKYGQRTMIDKSEAEHWWKVTAIVITR